jgi:hypothetical protein
MTIRIPKPSPNHGYYKLENGSLVQTDPVAKPISLAKLLNKSSTVKFKNVKITKTESENQFELSNGSILSLTQVMQYITGGEVVENF